MNCLHYQICYLPTHDVPTYVYVWGVCMECLCSDLALKQSWYVDANKAFCPQALWSVFKVLGRFLSSIRLSNFDFVQRLWKLKVVKCIFFFTKRIRKNGCKIWTAQMLEKSDTLPFVLIFPPPPHTCEEWRYPVHTWGYKLRLKTLCILFQFYTPKSYRYLFNAWCFPSQKTF